MKQSKKIEEYILIRFQLRKEIDNINKIIEYYNSLLVEIRNSYFGIQKLIDDKKY